MQQFLPQPNYGIGGYMTPQQRIANYEQQYASQQPMSFAQPQQIGFKMMPVTNEQEANATPIDIVNGTPSFFFNQSANEIYMKQSLPNGAASFVKFGKITTNNVNPVEKSYKNDFEALNKKIDGLYSLFSTASGAESISKGEKNAK